MWSVLKGGIGKELTKVPMPVSFNEPLSFLQRMAELMEFSELLQLAASQTDSICRMEVSKQDNHRGMEISWQDSISAEWGWLAGDHQNGGYLAGERHDIKVSHSHFSSLVYTVQNRFETITCLTQRIT